MFRKLISSILIASFTFSQTGFSQSLDLSQQFASMLAHNAQPITHDATFRPIHLRYFSYDTAKNNFQILLDKGDKKDIKDLELKSEAKELLNYFLIGVTLPNDTFWVNLRPDAPDSIIDQELEKTDIGKVFLEADLQLKKDTASWTSPQTQEGKAYWDKLYKKAGELFPSAGEHMTIPTLTRPWIVPNEIIIRETNDSAYIYKATLKVLLEEDYLQEHTSAVWNSHRGGVGSGYSFSDPRLKELNQYSTQLIKETIIPKLTQEVNSSKRYARLRQVYYSLILSRWFKTRFRSSRLTVDPSTALGAGSPQSREQANQYLRLIDSKDLTNLTSKEAWDKTTYFNQYKDSFNKGEYNIKEPIYTPYGQSIRSYVSGGLNMDMTSSPVVWGSFMGRVKRGFLAVIFSSGIVFGGSGLGWDFIKTSLADDRRKEVKNSSEIEIAQLRKSIKEMLDKWHTDKTNLWYQSKENDLDFYRLFFEREAGSIQILTSFLEYAQLKLRFYKPSSDNKGVYEQFQRVYDELTAMLKLLKATGQKTGENYSSKNKISSASPLTLRSLSVPIYGRLYKLNFVSAENNMDFVLETLKRPVELYTFDNRKVKTVYMSVEESDRVRIALGNGDRVQGVLIVEKKALIITNVNGKTLAICKALIIAGISELIEANKDKETITINSEHTSLNDDLLNWLNGLLGEKILEKKGQLISVEYSQAKDIIENWRQKTGVSEILSPYYLADDPPLLSCQKEVIIDAFRVYGKNIEFIKFDKLKDIIKEKLQNNQKYTDNRAIVALAEYLTSIGNLEKKTEFLTSLITNKERDGVGKDEQMKEKSEFLLKVMKGYFFVMAAMVEQELEEKSDKADSFFKEIEKGKYFRPGEEEWLRKNIFSGELKRKKEFLKNATEIIMAFLGKDTGYDMLQRDWYKIISFSIDLVNTAASIFAKSSSSLFMDTQASFSEYKRGGIDFTDRIMNDATKLERRGSFAGLDLNLPMIHDVERIDLDNEFSQIQVTIKAGIIPNGLRILEFIAACYQRNEFEARLPDIIACLNDACKLEELQGKESSPELRRALLAPDMLYAYGAQVSLN